MNSCCGMACLSKSAQSALTICSKRRRRSPIRKVTTALGSFEALREWICSLALQAVRRRLSTACRNSESAAKSGLPVFCNSALSWFNSAVKRFSLSVSTKLLCNFVAPDAACGVRQSHSPEFGKLTRCNDEVPAAQGGPAFQLFRGGDGDDAECRSIALVTSPEFLSE